MRMTVEPDIAHPVPNTGTLTTPAAQLHHLAETLSGKDIVVGAYFSQKVDAQHGVRIHPASFEYIADWFHSGIRLGLHMVILHDGLPEKFIKKCRFYYSLNATAPDKGSLHFVAYSPGRFTIADERFFAARDLLAALPTCTSAFIVDISDAWFNRPPANLIHTRSLWNYCDASRLLQACTTRSTIYPQVMRQRKVWKDRHTYTLFIGGETNTIGENPWMQHQLETVFGRPFPELATQPVLNCGIVGGLHMDVLSLLRTVCHTMEMQRTETSLSDMAVFNYVLHTATQYTIYTNGTLNSPWKTWKKRGTHAIFHK
ncbi:MAG: hypothetical protein MI749_16680 [Desulfovibrionales bacterium]|nr:hypothetical protein [Desulfovibrionales bacterium]